MPRSSYEQTSFIGGEFSAFSQGRSDLPQYRQGLSLSLNGHPIEEGAWVRRSGFEMIVPTRGRTFGRVINFDGSATCSFAMCFTVDNLQFITPSSIVFDNTVATITGSTAVDCAIEIGTPQSGWEAGDQVMLVFPDATSPLYPYPQALEAGLRGRMLTIAGVIDSSNFVLATDLGVNLDVDPSAPAWPSGALVGAQIMRVLNLATTYSTVQQLEDLRTVQIEYQAVVLSASVAPQVVQITQQPVVGPGGVDPVFTFGALGLVDGPYLDASGDTGTVDAYTGTVNFTTTALTPFVATDVGRHIRLLSQPADWNGGTSYSVGDLATDISGAWWTAIIANTGVTPGQPTVSGGIQQLAWAPAPLAGRWAWGKIASYVSTSHVTVALDATIPDMILVAANGTGIAAYQLGVYGATTTYPTCGIWDQGRLWLGGAQPNRFDTTTSNGVNLGIATFSPTDPYGNVLDSSGISEVLNSKYISNIQWMLSDEQGVIMGTLSGEFLVFASATNDPITPTNIDERMVTKYGAAFVEPVQAGMAKVFVQKYGRRLLEYVADGFTGKFTGRHLNAWNKRLSASGIAEIAYQEELFPCVWARMNNGLLAGALYRRFSRFVQEPPDMQGWHWHIHGRQRSITSMCVTPGKDGTLDRLFAVTNDPVSTSPINPAPSNYFVEIMQPVFDEEQSVLNGYFLDEFPGPGPGADPAYDCGGGNATIYLPSGSNGGADTTTPDVTTIFPYDTGIAPGSDLTPNLILKEASYLDGSTVLYTLPPFPSAGSQANEAALSLSVWVASEDFPLKAGALLSSPALTSAEAQAATNIVSTILGGDASEPVGNSILANSTTGNDAYPFEIAEVKDSGALTGGQVWNHLMIAAKTNGDGTVSVTAYMNETLIASTTSAGGLKNDNSMWPFLAQPGADKDIGLCVWAIGGTNAVHNKYVPSYTYTEVSAEGALKVPTLAEILQTLHAAGGDIPGLPALLAYAQALGHPQPPQLEVSKISLSGGLGNVPYSQALGGYVGYRGSVAELWIKPGSFIDWTSATNRGKFHWFDSTAERYKPLSLGSAGASTGLGTPWVYLSGPPDLFNLNRANGKRLAILGTGVIASPLTPPGGV